jgi:hypothetical protein
MGRIFLSPGLRPLTSTYECAAAVGASGDHALYEVTRDTSGWAE